MNCIYQFNFLDFSVISPVISSRISIHCMSFISLIIFHLSVDSQILFWEQVFSLINPSYELRWLETVFSNGFRVLMGRYCAYIQ